jgi:hypothetical protein
MKTHNERLDLVELDASQTVGASINWYLTHQPTEKAALERAYAINGLDPETLPSETTPQMRFRALRGDNMRIFCRLPNGERREFVSVPVKHTDARDATLLSFAYSANLAHGREKARLVQIGTITYDTASGAFSWRFAPDRMSAGESEDDYLQRSLEGMREHFCDVELVFFREFAINLLKEVDVYASAPHYDIARLRDILRDEFVKSGSYPLSARGGFWFAPRLSTGGPLEYVSRVMRAFERVSKDNRFLLLTMPKDEATVATAADAVETGLLSRIAAVEAALENVPEQTRAGQHDTRIDELTRIVHQGDLYAEVLGLMTTRLEERVTAVRKQIERQQRVFQAEQSALAKAEQQARLRARFGDRAIFATKAELYRHAQEAADSERGVSTREYHGAELTIRADAALGYTFAVDNHGEVQTGSSTTATLLVERLAGLMREDHADPTDE